MEDLIINVYQVFVRKLCKDASFIYKGELRDNACITNFIKLIDKAYGIESLGEVFIYDYFSFQLNYWVNLDTRFGKKIPITWFVGKKAFLRWKDNPNIDLYHAHKTSDLFGIDISAFNKSKKNIDALETKPYEEKEKIRFGHKESQFLHCIETTTLFNHRSTYCVLCENKISCKELLKVNFYRIYIKRGYSEKNSIKAR